MGGHCPEGHIIDPRNKRLEEMSRRQKKWKHLLREARAQKGLQGHRWRYDILGMKVVEKKQSTLSRPVQVPCWPPQILCGLACDQTQDSTNHLITGQFLFCVISNVLTFSMHHICLHYVSFF